MSLACCARHYSHPCFSRYDGLGVKEIRQLLDAQHPEVYEYLPEPELELPKVPKAWLANVCATVMKEKFSRWVKEQVEARHEKVAVKKDLMIKMDPEIAKVFQQSVAVSSKYSLFNSAPYLVFIS